MDTSTPCINLDQKNIILINEYKLNFKSTDYILKLLKLKQDLILLVNEQNIINSFGFQEIFSLEKLQKMNKIFRAFDSIDEVANSLEEIISLKKISLKKENSNIFITFKFNKPGKGEEDIIFTLVKANLSSNEIIENLISYINNLKKEIDDLKKNNIKKFIPKFENGWQNFYSSYEQLTIYKNSLGEVKFQGLITGDFSKKIFTLEEELRPKERLIFTICANDSFKRLDILQNGNVVLSHGGSEGIEGSGWLSLSGISYYV